jgi:hypothetical protein
MLAIVVASLAMLGASPATAASERRLQLAQAAPPVEAGRPARRAATPSTPPRARIYVRPQYPYRRFHSIYPLPYPVEYPGPHAVRHCTSHYEVEWRPSGEVVVPRMRCWWAPG